MLLVATEEDLPTRVAGGIPVLPVEHIGGNRNVGAQGSIRSLNQEQLIPVIVQSGKANLRSTTLRN